MTREEDLVVLWLLLSGAFWPFVVGLVIGWLVAQVKVTAAWRKRP